VAMGTVIVPDPVTGFVANFSPMPRIAPPPLGREIEGAANAERPPSVDSDGLSVAMPILCCSMDYVLARSARDDGVSMPSEDIVQTQVIGHLNGSATIAAVRAFPRNSMV
jgi:hypothetical protein